MNTRSFNKFPDFFIQAFKIVVDSWKSSKLLLYSLWDDGPIFMISGSNEQLQQQLEYTLLKPDCRSWWSSKLQSEREDTLEERYAITFWFKHGKKATEMYRIIQTAFGASCINRASVFECHKIFKEGSQSMRDDERCGRSKEVRKLELIGQEKNFMDKDRRVSIGTINSQFDISVGTVHTIIREELKMQKICAKFVLRVLREDQKERRCTWQQEDGRADQFRSRSSWYSGDQRWKLDQQLWPRDQETEFPVEVAGSPWPKNDRQFKCTHKHMIIPFLAGPAWSTCNGFPLDRQSTRNTMLKF